MSAVFVITGPSGVGKGTVIRALRGLVPELELSTSATTRRPREGEEDGVDYHFLAPEEFARRVEAGDFIEHATYSGNRYGTLRSEVEERNLRGAPVVLEIELQGARQVRASMPEAVQIFIAPPDPADLRRRLEGRGTDDAETIEARLKVAEEELAAQGEFSHSIVNDDVDRAAARTGGDSAKSGLSADAALPLGACPKLPAMVKPRVDKLMDRTDSHYTAVVVAAKRARQLNSYYRALGEGTYEEHTPPMVESESDNYLTIALEELAAGKINHEYRH